MKKALSKRTLNQFAVALAAVLTIADASAQVTVYSENFDADNTANWVTNVTGAGFSFADFYFDYSTVGIPPAPNSAGGTTRGLKLAANLGSGGVFPAGISVSPLNFGITVNFEMRFDMWMNYIKSGQGSTEVGGAGYGTAATSAQVAGVADSIFIGASTDGGTTSDYRVYGPGVAISYQDTDHIIRTDPSTPLVYAAGGRNNSNPYYVSRFPAQPVPEAQTNLFPRQAGTLAPAGSIAFKWHDVKLRKVGRYITYFIDDHLIATVDSVDATTITNTGAIAPLGGTNIHFNLYDINTGGSTDIDSTNLLFALYDNVRITDFTNVVTVEATTPITKEGSGIPAVFTLTRSAAGQAVTINYTMTGTATSGQDYTLLSGSVTFDAPATSTNIMIEAIDDAVAELTETVIFNITPSPFYVSGEGATVTIQDNELNVLTLSSVTSQMYERTNDYCSMRVSRLGDLQTPTYTVNLAFAGSGSSSDFSPPMAVTMEPGVGTTNFIISPVEDVLYEGNETVIVSLAAATGGQYTVGSPNSVVNAIVDATLPETILFSDNFDDSFNSFMWITYATDTNGPATDNSIAYAYDYSGLGIPPSPHGDGSTFGLLLTVNKSDTDPRAAAVNMYAREQNFSGDFALRFDMFLSIVPGTSVATEHALCGINHSGLNTNWFRHSPGGVGSPDWAFDGVFSAIGADASGAAPGDYGLFSSPNTSTTAGPNPTALVTVPASRFTTNEFKRPPYAIAGAPGNNPSATLPTPIWTDVEFSKIGNVVTLKINNTTILSTNFGAYTSGTIMLGYVDAYDSIGGPTSYVVYDNVRVVSLSGLRITSVRDLGTDMQLDFTFDLHATPSSFKVQSAPNLSQTFAEAAATIVQLSPGRYRASVLKSGGAQFYRIRNL